mmetsp:Transcript_10470/g.21178  ORF Transcript_10470/g.21178 Transcript_10470/m.21178 type:complete len:225 (-) Transcript_10470:438-1112(-)
MAVSFWCKQDVALDDHGSGAPVATRITAGIGTLGVDRHVADRLRSVLGGAAASTPARAAGSSLPLCLALFVINSGEVRLVACVDHGVGARGSDHADDHIGRAEVFGDDILEVLGLVARVGVLSACRACGEASGESAEVQLPAAAPRRLNGGERRDGLEPCNDGCSSRWRWRGRRRRRRERRRGARDIRDCVVGDGLHHHVASQKSLRRSCGGDLGLQGGLRARR